MAYPSLSYLDLRNAVRGKRFPNSMDGSINRALATAYSEVWTTRAWPFKKVFRASLTVDSATPALPSDFRSCIQVIDDLGSKLLELSYEEYDRLYGYSLVKGMVGRPEAWTEIDGVVNFGPAPNGSYAFKMTYHRRLCSMTSAGAVQAGFMVADTDTPVWQEHHGVLIPRATSILLVELGDITANTFLAEYDRQLTAMTDEYPTPTISFGEYEG